MRLAPAWPFRGELNIVRSLRSVHRTVRRRPASQASLRKVPRADGRGARPARSPWVPRRARKSARRSTNAPGLACRPPPSDWALPVIRQARELLDRIEARSGTALFARERAPNLGLRGTDDATLGPHAPERFPQRARSVPARPPSGARSLDFRPDPRRRFASAPDRRTRAPKPPPRAIPRHPNPIPQVPARNRLAAGR